MSTICMSFSHISFGEEIYDKRERTVSLYNPNEKEQSVLFTFLHSRWFLEHVAVIIERNDFCDYCKLRESFKFKFSEGLPDFFKELGFSPDDSSESSNSNCNLCELSKKLPFKGLDKALHAKLTELYTAELNLLKEEDSEIAEEVNQFLGNFNYDSEEDLAERNVLYRKLYNKIKKIGDFPNLLDKMALLTTVTNDILVFVQAMQKTEDLSGVIINLHFAQDLALYKKFLSDHNDILIAMENIVRIGFEIEDTKNIKTLSEIMTQAEKSYKEQESDVEKISDLKDLL